MPRPPRAHRFALGATALGLLLSLACATEQKQTRKPATPKKTEAAAQAKPAAPPVDPHALCEVYARLQQAQRRGETAALSAELEKASADDHAARFGRLLSIENEQERWKAFHALTKDDEASVVGPLGECFVYATWKMPDRAEARCSEAEGRASGLALASVARADLAARRGNKDDAIAKLDQAIATDARCVPAHVAKARLLSDLGRTAEAEAAWVKALEQWPKCFSCASARASLVEARDGVEAALPHWEKALEIAPDDPSTLNRYAAAQVGRDDKKALGAYEKALRSGSANPGTVVAAARLAHKIGDTVKATDYAEKASELEPDSVDVWRFLVDLYESRKEAAGHERALGEVLRLLPDDAPAHLAIARLSLKREEYVDALEHYESAVRSLEEAPTEVGTPEEAATMKTAADKELAELRQKLSIATPGATGSADYVVNAVQRAARGLYEQRLAQRKGLKGTVELSVRTNADGGVETVDIKSDTLKDSQVVASLVGNLRLATIHGGAQKLSFELSFE